MTTTTASTFAAVRELLGLAWSSDRAKLVKSVLLLGGGFLATPLIALGLRGLTDALLASDTTTALRYGIVLSVLLMLELMGMHFAHLSYFELGEMSQVHLQQRLYGAANADLPLAQREQPEYADEFQVAQSQAWQINRALEAVLEFGGLLLQLAVSTVLLARLNALLLLVPCLSVFLVLASARAQREINKAQEAAAEESRRARHFMRLATAPDSLIELGLLGLEAEVADRHDAAWERATRHLWRGFRLAALIKALGQFGFAVGYAVALVFVFRQVAAGEASIGDFVMVLALAVQTTLQIANAVTLLAVLQQAGVTIGRVNRLSQAAPEPARQADRIRPAEAGIVLRGLGFSYPGASRPVLEGVDLVFPPGSIVAVVGENGAGKSTLIKLLCGLYRPTSGSIWFDGRPVTGEAGQVASLFQDFARMELALRDSVGVGGCDGVKPAGDAAVSRALGQADLSDLPDRLDSGLASILGTRYEPGAELSGGQWQRVGLSRALVRPHPVLLTLDEPAAALDPLAEHALFERFAAAARRQDARGAVTVYVSHRFSTVRMADLIVVLDGGKVVGVGTHDELMRAGGLYAELYTRQARTYAK